MLMIGVIGLWIISVVLGYHMKAWGLFIGLIVVHIAELPFALKIGKGNGLSVQTVVTKTMIYGFTWWVAIKKGIIDK